MKENNIKYNFFGDAMKIFVGYIARQLKRNPQYKPHPLIRAFQSALDLVADAKNGECVITVTQDGKGNLMQNPYLVVLEKKKQGVEVKEIVNLLVNKTLPVDIMITIFRIQIHLDKIDSETVSPEQMVDVLNAVIPGKKFHFLGDGWKEARDEFKKLLEAGKIQVPNDPALVQELSQIKWDASWEEYSSRLRCLIGQSLVPILDKQGNIVVVTSPKNARIEKSQVFDYATELMIGESAKYIDLFGQGKN